MASINERKAFRLSVIIVLLIAVIACMIISLIWGSTAVSLAEIWRTLWSDELTDTASQIIWNIRLPRNIVAALVGACLAVSGAILQAVMKNPLADPQIVGVSSGAGLAGVIVLILFPGYDYIVPLVAFLG
ncbi:iron chelate uptake ABC transporter family permease subunit, partial [uncultured Veillonella sp.]|uniref:iron chelate uptake ABC transporter family permease subunit n=1 Tax=uncultured Veillonella sp. TaxID=159268 RepID=UPI0025DF9F91